MTPGKNGYVAVAVGSDRSSPIPPDVIDLASWSANLADTNNRAWQWQHTCAADMIVMIVETPITPSSLVRSPEGILRVRGVLR